VFKVQVFAKFVGYDILGNYRFE